jgi:hypothetical protein
MDIDEVKNKVVDAATEAQLNAMELAKKAKKKAKKAKKKAKELAKEAKRLADEAGEKAKDLVSDEKIDAGAAFLKKHNG